MFDVIVVGSGCAGLVAALRAVLGGARVLVLEKTPSVGGTTALSGGTMWIPGNHLAAAEGCADDIGAALTYLLAGGGPTAQQGRLEVFVRTAATALRFVERETGLSFLLGKDTDYRPELPGGRQLGRSVIPAQFDPGVLGDRAQDVRSSDLPLDKAEIFGSLNWSAHAEAASGATSHRPNGGTGAWTRGRALVGALYAACLRLGVQVRLSQRVRRLTMDGGRVSGVTVETSDRLVTITAPAVILASGGFEWDPELVNAFLGRPLEAAASPPAMEGDGLRMAMAAGAQLGSMTEAWWSPLIRIPGEIYDGRPAARMVVSQRLYPHSLMVDGTGRRFVNEALNYHDAGAVLMDVSYAGSGRAHSPAWLIFDRNYRVRYGVASVGPGESDPNWLPAYATVTQMAEGLGLDTVTLLRTIETFNAGARAGRDPEFSRGQSAYALSKGDRSQSGIQRTLGAVAEPPFYAVRLYAGTIGTCGGPQTDAAARVLDAWGRAIEGLFAAGNVAASGTGLLYPGAGGTLGLAATFGFIAGAQALERPG